MLAPLLCALPLAAPFALARPELDCARWSAGFRLPGTDQPVSAVEVLDVGRGPELVIAGFFAHVGELDAKAIAAFDGSSWRAFGSGLNLPGVGTSIPALASFGGELVAGGSISSGGDGTPLHHLVHWDGTSWSDLAGGTDAPVHALLVHGGKLYVGGEFAHAGGIPAARVAVFDGTSWSALGAGVAGFAVDAIASFPDASGDALYFGGQFASAGGIASSCIARWSNGAWSSVDAGAFNGLPYATAVHALAVHDDGSGLALYAGGQFDRVGSVPLSAQCVARWDGASWSAVGSGMPDPAASVDALRAHVGVAGPVLVAGGSLDLSGPAAFAQAWDGTHWNALGPGVDARVRAFADFQGELVAGGEFFGSAEHSALGVARYDGGAWSALFQGQGVAGLVKAFAVHDPGTGPALCAIGAFSNAGGSVAPAIALWNGAQWASAPGAFDPTYTADAIASYDDGSGARLFVSGSHHVGAFETTRLFAWDGTSTSLVLPGGSDVIGRIDAMCVYDGGSGPELYVAGRDFQVPGTSSTNVARFDGQSWSGVGGGVDGLVDALCVFDDGTGSALYVGGLFTRAGATTVRSIARWDGANWSDVGGGLGRVGGPAQVRSLAVHDEGGGPVLFAGGFVTEAGGAPAPGLARWDGASWTDVGGGIDALPNGGSVSALASFDDGSGPALYVAGDFTLAGGSPIPGGIARWDGTGWSEVDGGFVFLEPTVSAPGWTRLAVYDDALGSGPSLFAGGWFARAGAHASYDVARLSRREAVGTAVCPGDGSGAPCGCGNESLADPPSGCLNSASVAGVGAQLVTSGNASASSPALFLCASGVRTHPGLFFQGDHAIAGGTGATFGDGIRCCGGGVRRLAVIDPPPGPEPTSASFALRSLPPGVIPGSLRCYQYWYRDPSGPCGAHFNLSTARVVTWMP